MSSVEKFAGQVLSSAPGHAVRFAEFWDKYELNCYRNGLQIVGRVNAIRKLQSVGYLIGRGRGNVTYVGNVAFQKVTPREPLALSNSGRLVNGSTNEI